MDQPMPGHAPRSKERSLVYGPVPSRRLGISLGVDLIPHKVCTLDCLYCQVGVTTRPDITRRDFGAPPERVIEQVEAALARHPQIQVITLAGSGEPTLYEPLEALIKGLRQVTPLPLVLLTNGSLLWDPEVRSAAALLDQVYPSLDAADEQTFQRINRPAPGKITLAWLLSGLEQFCVDFTGRCRLELMLVRGINDSPESLAAMADLARGLNIEGVDLNTVVRPPAHAEAQALTPAQMEAARQYFQGLDPQVIASFCSARSGGAAPDQDTREQILTTVARRPCTAADLEASLGVESRELLEEMVEEGVLRKKGDYFKP